MRSPPRCWWTTCQSATGDLILVRIGGSHFIWKMVRRMVGVLVEVGCGGWRRT